MQERTPDGTAAKSSGDISPSDVSGSKSSRVEVVRHGPVAAVALSNPPHGLMDEAMEQELAAVVEELEADPSIRAVVLTGGQEGVFVRHYDVAVLERRGRALAARGLSFSPERPVPEATFHGTLRRMEESNKAYVAALNGTAMGGGFELALACDLRLVQDGPFDLGLPEINLGILPGAGGTQRLPRLIGQARALELTLLGGTLSPRRTTEIGLALACIEGPVLPVALETAQRLAAKPPQALAHIKRLVRGAAATPLADGLAAERTLFCDLMIRDDALTLMTEWTEGHRDIRDDP
ncbi:MAG: enoyl-CoA hydratase/isomerase family protein [Kiloniellales bacterium]